MILIGEKLNSSIPSTHDLMEANDLDALTDLARSQALAGADYIDINTALTPKETELMSAIIDRLEDVPAGICIDSPDSRVIRALLPAVKGKQCLINSTDDLRLPQIIDDLADTDAGIILIPRLNDKFVSLKEAVRMLTEAGIERDRIYADVVVEALAVNTQAAQNVLALMNYAKEELGILTLAGLSNISFGLPSRRTLNSAFMSLLAYHGLDAAICDVLDPALMGACAAGFALSGGDDFCMEYLNKMRK